jgi:predicted dehydrogenase
MRQVNIGIIGVGGQGKIHIRNCLHMPNVKLWAAADVSQKGRAYAEKVGIRKTYKDYEDLLKDQKVDAVIIGLPNFLHHDSAVKAAEAKKDILLEKPLARNVREGEEILAAARKNRVKLMLGYDMRFSPVLQKLHERINDGFFGEVQIAEVTFVGLGPFTSRSYMTEPQPVPSWWFDKELVGGGALLDLGSHMINLLAWYFGGVRSAKSYLGYKYNMELEDLATCFLEFNNGTIAIINVGWFSKDFIRSIQIFGTAKSFFTHIARRTRSSIIWNDIKRRFGLHSHDVYFAEIEHFVECVRNDVQPSPSGEEGLLDLQIITMAYNNASRIT